MTSVLKHLIFASCGWWAVQSENLMHNWKWSIEWMNVSIENGRALIDIKMEFYDQSCFPWMKYVWMYGNMSVLFSSGGSKPFRKPWFLNQTWIFSSEVVSRPRSRVDVDFGPLTDPRLGAVSSGRTPDGLFESHGSAAPTARAEPWRTGSRLSKYIFLRVRVTAAWQRHLRSQFVVTTVGQRSSLEMCVWKWGETGLRNPRKSRNYFKSHKLKEELKKINKSAKLSAIIRTLNCFVKLLLKMFSLHKTSSSSTQSIWKVFFIWFIGAKYCLFIPRQDFCCENLTFTMKQEVDALHVDLAG